MGHDAQAIAEAALRAAGLGSPRAMGAVGGGDIAAAYRVDDGSTVAFLKIGLAGHPFDGEARALAAIAATATLRVPRVLACGVAGAAGSRLARLHACVEARFGWERDNTIGASPQINTPSANWAEFYRERRLRPQFALAAAAGHQRLPRLEAQACAASDALLGSHEPPASLLHGDLWRGNLAFDERGEPVVFDPAAYYGDAETDLAMSRLFGGFPDRFFRAYANERPPSPGARERLPLYQLYHVLNHANLFGGGYVAQAVALIARLARGE